MLFFKSIELKNRPDHYVASKSLADSLNNLKLRKTCDAHPLYTHEIGIHIIDADPAFKIIDYCCEDFKAKLDAFLKDMPENG